MRQQERAIQDKNEQTIRDIDEVVELWNSMWIADFAHDQAIADNVKGMQSRCRQILHQLNEGIEQLMHLDGDKPRNKKLGAAPPSR